MTSEPSKAGGIVPVALDAMGGDHAPAETVAGAVLAARAGGTAVLLVGDPAQLSAELVKHEGADKLPIQVVPSEGVVQEDEQPALAFRSKPKASIFVAAGLVKMGKASAMVSMGSTGATIAAATVVFGTFEGLDRGALGGPIIGLSPDTIIIDVGTNVDCRARQLADFAALGTVMSRTVFNADNPRVALLSVGAEIGKGNRLVREATELLQASGLNFIGNVEANDLPFNKAEVVICDGFVGNVVMKLTEALGDAIATEIRSRGGGEDLASHIFKLTNVVETHGGGPIFGVKGVAIVGHGKARAESVARAIGTARLTVAKGYVEAAATELDRMRSALN